MAKANSKASGNREACKAVKRAVKQHKKSKTNRRAKRG